MENLLIDTYHRIKIESQEDFQEKYQENFFLRNRAPAQGGDLRQALQERGQGSIYRQE